MRALLLSLLCLVQAPVFGAVILTATPSSASVAPGGSFTVAFAAETTTEGVDGFAFYLSTTVPDSGLFTVIATSLEDEFEYLIAPDNPFVLTASPSQEYGAWRADAPELPPGGPYALAVLTIQAHAGLSPGMHQLTIDAASGTFADGFVFTTILAPVTFSILVIPEPNGAAVLGLGVILLFRIAGICSRGPEDKKDPRNVT